jgi:Protein of unknown function (DUF3305)
MAFNRTTNRDAPRWSASGTREFVRQAMSEKSKANLPLGIVVERRAVDNPWIDHKWRSIAVIAGAPPLSPFDAWTLMRQGDGWAQFHAGTLNLELFRKETEGYKVNLSQQPPRLFIVLRGGDEDRSDHEVVPFLVTVSPYEAQDYLDSGEDQVDAVPMPDGVIAFVQDFIERHHVDEPFRKRKRTRADTGDEAFARRPVGDRRRGGRDGDG